MITEDPGTFMTSPLAMQFMTQGQMGYMPEAQFLTPASYGAFRTMPTSPMHNFPNQEPGFLQSYLIRNRGSILGLPNYTFNTYNPAVNLQEYMNKMTLRSYDQVAAGLGTVADTVASPLVGALAGMAFGGPVGFAAGMLMPSISQPFTDRIRDMRAIQNMTMSKIVGGRDMNPVTGMGFNAASARDIDSFLRISGAGDALLKEGDWRKLMQLGIENGQFDYAQNAQQYKDILKKLRGSVTTMMEVVGSSDFKDVMKEFKRLQTMGADISQYNNIARKEQLFSRITGLSQQDMVSTYGQQGALIYSQAGLTNYQGSLQAMNNAATIAMGQRMGLVSQGMVARYGGVSGLAQSMTQQDAQAQKTIQDYILPYLMNKDMTGLDPNAKLTDIIKSDNPLLTMNSATGRKLQSPQDFMRYQQNRADLLQQAIDTYGQDTILAVTANAIGRSAGLNGREATTYGFRIQGMDAETAALKTNRIYSDEFRDQEQRERSLARRKKREEEEMANSPLRRLSRSLDKFVTEMYENGPGKWVKAYGEYTEQKAMEANGLYHNDVSKQAANKEWSKNYSPSSQGGEALALGDLGALSAKYESGAKGSRAIGYDRTGGTSYGTYQLSSKQGSVKEFLEFLRTKGDEGVDIAKRLEAAGVTQDTGSNQGAGPDAWKAIAAEKGEKFKQLENEFYKKKFYDPIYANLDPKIKEQIDKSDTLKQVLMSTVVQHRGYTPGIFNKAWARSGGKIDNFIKEIYEERKTRFPSSTPAVQAAVRQRFVDEGADAQAMLAKEMQSPPKISPEQELRRQEANKRMKDNITRAYNEHNSSTLNTSIFGGGEVADVDYLSSVINRLDRGVGLTKAGDNDYAGLAKMIAERTGLDPSKLEGGALRKAIKDKGIKEDWNTEGSARSHVADVLRESGLSKEEAEKAAKDPTVVAAIMAGGLRAAGMREGEKGATIASAWRTKLQNEQDARGGAGNKTTQDYAKKAIQEHKDAFLPGYGDLSNSTYGEAKKRMDAVFTGDKGTTPLAANLARMAALSTAYHADKDKNGNKNEEYATAYMAEAKRLGIDDKRAKELLVGGGDVELADLKANKGFAKATADDIKAYAQIGRATGEAAIAKGNAKKSLIDNFRSAMAGSDGVIPEKSRALLEAHTEQGMLSMALKYQIKPEEMTTEQGLLRLQKEVDQRGSEDEKRVVDATLKKVQAAKKRGKTYQVSPEDFKLNLEGKYQSSEDYTAAAKNEKNPASAANAALNAEANKKSATPKPEVKEDKSASSKSASPSSGGSGTLQDSTVQDLTKVLQELKAVLEKSGQRGAYNMNRAIY